MTGTQELDINMRIYTSEEVKDDFWKDGIQISYADMRVLMRYLGVHKIKGRYALTYDDYVKLKKFLLLDDKLLR